MRLDKNFYNFIIICGLILMGNICFAENRPDSFSGKGYVGTLPNLTRGFVPIQEKQTTPDINPAKDFNSENEIKPAPRENPAFVNIILKSDKTSQYVNDINEFIPILEKLDDLIDDNSNIQIFNAKVYYFNKNADYLRDKYKNKPESEFVSYKKLLSLSTHAKSIALLRNEALKYNPFLASGNSEYIYNPNNINQQLQYLKSEIKQTILLLKESN